MQLEVKEELNNNTRTLFLTGRLNTLTAPILEDKIEEYSNLPKLIINCKELEYISSAGLRVLLQFYKSMSKTGELIIVQVPENIYEIFEVTGFSDILNIQEEI